MYIYIKAMFFKSSPRRYFFGHCWGKFSGANLYQYVGGLSGVFCVLFMGKCCAFFCSAFSRRLRLCFSKVRPEDIFPDIVGENFRVRTCTGSVFSGFVVDFYMEYCPDRISPISVGSLLGKIALSSLCPMVCPVVRLFARVGST